MKIKEALLKEQETQMQYHAKFMDWMYDNLVQNQMSEEDIDNLEESQRQSPKPCSKETISRFRLNPTNNKHYTPLIGA